MNYDQMTAADAVFLRLEHEGEPQHVGSLSIFEGGALRDDRGAIDIDRLRQHVTRRLHRVPRLRQRVMEVPMSAGRPVWVDDDRFDIDYHVRLTALPRPGGRDELLALMSRVQEIPLDRSRPLWEMWFVDGLDHDRVGLIIKCHHALGDGIANVDLALALVDLEEHPPPDDDLPDWRPRPAPSAGALFADAIATQMTRPARLGYSAARAALDPRPAIRAGTDVAATARDLLVRRTPAPWNVSIGAHRRWVSATVPLEQVRSVRSGHDATLNDVVLAACAGALRTFLAAHDDPDGRLAADGAPLRAMVPVSVREEDEHGKTLGNRISLILVELPVSLADPVDRLVDVHEQTSRLKGSSMVDGAQTILELADGIPPLAGVLTNVVSRRIPMNLVVTNVPGPPIPLWMQGARMVEAYPYVEVIDNEGLTIAVVSYDDQLFFGITADREAMPDVEDLATAIVDEFAALASG